jgi:hypothetical protein
MIAAHIPSTLTITIKTTVIKKENLLYDRWIKRANDPSDSIF